ncbi:YnfA family protein [Paenalcaligenes niemegkensis]|uniref:YnfA family protein n=1 Tax=Paenalcaligenes niemegkensis TaxID=2895469 RepID=UPI001EE8A992|nr:YnfA family protein [Paenalcaligenes niemegkensis]MCQ9616701.1 YnfA family protein [Paenalcaligenes niemegkensis]
MVVKAFLLFLLTAIAEIVGCYLPYLWLKEGKSAWLLLPTVISLAAFVWLLTLHPTASGRVYAAYGGVYVITALFWLRWIDGARLSQWDWLGGALTLSGMAVIVVGSMSKAG